MTSKVAIALSGGVDSAVAASLLMKKRYKCFAVHLDLGINDKSHEDAEKIAKKLGIKFHILDFKKEFKKEVINYYLDAYKKGLTPNPCVICNEKIKFGALLDKVKTMGADYLATGHYARIKGRMLYRGKDKSKDQSYFLYRLSQDQLKHVLFPLGDKKKTETRKIAKELGLKIIEDKKESQGICFIPDKFYTDFLKKNLPEKYFKQGLIMDSEGNKLGRHRGLPYYTCGQRKGLRIGGLKDPYYVIKTDQKKNELIVGGDKKLWHKAIYAQDLSFISGKAPTGKTKIQARIRHLGRLQKATLETLDENTAIIRFPKPVRAFTEGQSIVFYQRSGVIGGGVMRFASPTDLKA